MVRVKTKQNWVITGIYGTRREVNSHTLESSKQLQMHWLYKQKEQHKQANKKLQFCPSLKPNGISRGISMALLLVTDNVVKNTAFSVTLLEAICFHLSLEGNW